LIKKGKIKLIADWKISFSLMGDSSSFSSKLVGWSWIIFWIYFSCSKNVVKIKFFVQKSGFENILLRMDSILEKNKYKDFV
jgi:hypothetical protein